MKFKKFTNSSLKLKYENIYKKGAYKKFFSFDKNSIQNSLVKSISNWSKLVVLDFGCGGGFLLNNLVCKKKTGIEVNDIARNYCINKFGIECFMSLDEIENNSIDVIISNHCLEHCSNPDNILSGLFKKLKTGGKIIICVPLDSRKLRYKKNDINFHLYSFSPMNLGNLLINNGFEVLLSKTLYHKWPPKVYLLSRIIGTKALHSISYLYGRVNFRFTQTIAFGLKPN